MPNYWAVVTRAMQQGHAQGKRMIVRHLLMPGHFACCTEPVLRWLAEKPEIEVSLLTQYIAPAHARGELALPLAEADVAQAMRLARQLRLRLVG